MNPQPRRRRSIQALRLATAANLLGIGVAGAQTQPPQSPRTTPFRATTEIVEVDVRVSDRDGRFPTDLRKEDFIVLEDGVPQQIQTMFLAGVPGGFTGSEANRPDPQTWIFVFDDTHMQSSGLRRAKLALEGFIRRRLPGQDLAAIVYQGALIGNGLPRHATRHSRHWRRSGLPGESAGETSSLARAAT